MGTRKWFKRELGENWQIVREKEQGDNLEEEVDTTG
jgi:hypothetical protein